jgi:hypothetical protein
MAMWGLINLKLLVEAPGIQPVISRGKPLILIFTCADRPAGSCVTPS